MWPANLVCAQSGRVRFREHVTPRQTREKVASGRVPWWGTTGPGSQLSTSRDTNNHPPNLELLTKLLVLLITVAIDTSSHLKSVSHNSSPKSHWISSCRLRHHTTRHTSATRESFYTTTKHANMISPSPEFPMSVHTAPFISFPIPESRGQC